MEACIAKPESVATNFMACVQYLFAGKPRLGWPWTIMDIPYGKTRRRAWHGSKLLATTASTCLIRCVCRCLCRLKIVLLRPVIIGRCSRRAATMNQIDMA